MTELAVPDDGQLSIRALAQEALATFDEPSLIVKMSLLGVPHVITKVSYRPGVGNKDYVSCEAQVGSQSDMLEAVSRGWIPQEHLNNLPKPGEKLIYNDGSTGIRRQITRELFRAKLIDLPRSSGKDDDFDQPYTDWTMCAQTGEMNGDGDDKIVIPEFTKSPSGGPFYITAFHGLRVSHLDDWDKDVFYLS